MSTTYSMEQRRPRSILPNPTHRSKLITYLKHLLHILTFPPSLLPHSSLTPPSLLPHSSLTPPLLCIPYNSGSPCSDARSWDFKATSESSVRTWYLRGVALVLSGGYHAAPRSTTHAAPRSTTQHHAAPRSTTQHHAAPRSTTQHTTQHHAAPRSTTQHTTQEEENERVGGHTFHERAIAEQIETSLHQQRMPSWAHEAYKRRMAAPCLSTLNGSHEWVNKLHLQRASKGRNGEMGEQKEGGREGRRKNKREKKGRADGLHTVERQK